MLGRQAIALDFREAQHLAAGLGDSLFCIKFLRIR